MDAAEFLERVGQTADTQPVESWERDRYNEREWWNIMHGRAEPEPRERQP